MEKNKKFCIVIPIYKEKIDIIEEVSIKKLQNIIGDKNYDIYLITHKDLDLSIYNNYLTNYKIKFFDKKYFESTWSYSQMCISYDFYDTFSEYEYMYIYQLDCYLFEDKLEFWCNQGFDYIGGPIISTDCGWDTIKKAQKKYQPYVGNGGFSLRKIDVFKDICDPNGELRQTYKELDDEYLSTIRFEDKYFCNDLYNFYKLNIPTFNVAVWFALDMSVDVIYNYFKWEGTPMACHSWDKNIRYWKKVLPELQNRQDVIDLCEEKHKEFFKIYYDENDSSLRQ
jgi:hypothetical protein